MVKENLEVHMLHIWKLEKVTHAGITHYNIPTTQSKLAGFGLHPFLVHIALILSAGTRPGLQL